MFRRATIGMAIAFALGLALPDHAMREIRVLPPADRPEIPRAQVTKDGRWVVFDRYTDEVKR
jgi:hypothetical protein